VNQPGTAFAGLLRARPLARVAVRAQRDDLPMRTSSIRAGDIVYANKRGRLFHAKVISIDADATLTVEPIERNISYRHLQASEIAEHWARNSAARRTTSAPKSQTSLDLAVPL